MSSKFYAPRPKAKKTSDADMSIAAEISSNETWARAAIAEASGVTLLNVGSHPHTWLISLLNQVGLFMAVDRVLP